jgi:uncharacterized protein
MTATLLKKS